MKNQNTHTQGVLLCVWYVSIGTCGVYVCVCSECVCVYVGCVCVYIYVGCVYGAFVDVCGVHMWGCGGGYVCVHVGVRYVSVCLFV